MSQQDLNAFADWLVANPNKKGTPQYDTIAKAFKELDGQQTQEKDTSFSSAFQSGIDAPLENMATTARMVGAEGTADTLSGLTDAPTNYESASDRFTNPQEGDFTIGGFAPAYLPRAGVEQAGQFAGSMATRAGGAAIGGAVAGPAGAVAGGLTGPALFEFVQQLGPVAAKRAKNNGRAEPNWEDWKAAAATAGVSGALNAIGVKGGAGASLLKKTLKEGVTEGTQSVVEQTGSTAGTEAGLNIDPKQAIGEGIIGGTSAGGVNTAASTVSGAANLTGRGLRAAKNAVSPSETATDTEAATDFANDLDRVSQQDGYSLTDVDTGSATGARAAIDTLHSEYGSQIEVLVKDLTDRLKITADDTQIKALEKAKANAAKRKAKNKVKSRVDPTDIATVEKLTAGTQEGAQLLALMRKSNELSALANQSLKGGISQYTDVFNPLDTDGRYNVGRAIAAPVSGLSAITSGGASLAPAIAGRAIDAVTGRRSRVANYVKANRGQKGIPTTNLPSLRTQAQIKKLQETQKLQAEKDKVAQESQQKAEMDKEFAIANAQSAAPATPQSPQDTMERGTGLERNDVAKILRVLAQKSKSNTAIQQAIKDYRKSVGVGGYVNRLSPLIRQVNQIADTVPKFGNLRKAEPDVEVVQRQEADETRREQGKIENQEFNRQLFDAAEQDATASDKDKAMAKVALDDLSRNLGLYPADQAEIILSDVRLRADDSKVMDQYVKPYVERVKAQQRNNN